MSSNFVDVMTALSSLGFTDVIGVVVDILYPTQLNNGAWIVTFTLKDSDFDQKSWMGLKIKYFARRRELLPSVQMYDVILLWGLRVRILSLSLSLSLSSCI